MSNIRFNPPFKPIYRKDDSTTWYIKMYGKYVVMESGKWRWHQLGHAKSALKNHCMMEMEALRRSLRNKGYTYSEADAKVEETYQRWVEDNVEFTQVPPSKENT